MAKDVTLFVGDVHVKHCNATTELRTLVDTLERILNKGFGDDDAGESRRRYDRVVFAGDILDKHDCVNVQLMNAALRMIDRCRRAVDVVYVLVGNHDYIDNQQFLTDEHWMNALKEWKGVVVVDRPIIISTTDGAMALTPYVYPGRLVEALDATVGRSTWTNCVCVFAHQEMRGAKMGAIKSKHGDEWLAEWPTIVSGHVHERQRPAPNVFYPGSALVHAFGATATRDGCGGGSVSALYDFARTPPGTFEERRIALVGIDRKRTIRYRLTGDWTEDARNILTMIEREKSLSSRLRVVIRGTTTMLGEFKKTMSCADVKGKSDVAKVVFRPLNDDDEDDDDDDDDGEGGKRRRLNDDVAAVADEKPEARRGRFHDIVRRMVNDRADETDLMAEYRLVFSDSAASVL